MEAAPVCESRCEGPEALRLGSWAVRRDGAGCARECLCQPRGCERLDCAGVKCADGAPYDLVTDDRYCYACTCKRDGE